jgi:hypothetical protein
MYRDLAQSVTTVLALKVQGPNSQNFFSQICKIFVTLDFNILELLRLKWFLKQISVKLDVFYYRSN